MTIIKGHNTFPPDVPQDTLIQAVIAAKKDNGLFGELYRLSVKRVFRYLYSRTGNREDAEDLTAQTFLSAYEAFYRLKRDDRFIPWLFSIARNKLNDHYRKRKPLSPLDSADHVSENHNLLTEVIQSEQTARLGELIRSLPEKDQELLRLRFLAELQFSEMGDVLHRREDTVKKQVYRLLSRIQKQMEVSHE